MKIVLLAFSLLCLSLSTYAATCVSNLKIKYRELNVNQSFTAKRVCYDQKSKRVYQQCNNCLAVKEMKSPLYLKKGRVSSPEYRICSLKDSRVLNVSFKINNKNYKSTICKFKDNSIGSSSFYFKDLNSI